MASPGRLHEIGLQQHVWLPATRAVSGCCSLCVPLQTQMLLDAAWSVVGVRSRLLQPVHASADAKVVQRDGARLAAAQMRSEAVAARACQCRNVTIADANVVQLDAAWPVSGVRSRLLQLVHATADANVVQLDVSGARSTLLQPVHGTVDAKVVQRDGARLAATQMRSEVVAARA